MAIFSISQIGPSTISFTRRCRSTLRRRLPCSTGEGHQRRNGFDPSLNAHLLARSRNCSGNCGNIAGRRSRRGTFHLRQRHCHPALDQIGGWTVLRGVDGSRSLFPPGATRAPREVERTHLHDRAPSQTTNGRRYWTFRWLFPVTQLARHQNHAIWPPGSLGSQAQERVVA